MTDAELMATALIGLGHQRDEIEEKMAELRRQIEARPGSRPGRLPLTERKLHRLQKNGRGAQQCAGGWLRRSGSGGRL
jgi:hypothetical protein